ncbi:tetratricopeptide repeat protein [Candidatus Dojkabacteria bacterium]|nr:tetratricopeptide repeat protein [Candidatus Dojkabacteria bacterium]
METTETTFNTEFIDNAVEKQPYLDTPTQGALEKWCKANDSIMPVFVDREEWAKRKEEGTILEIQSNKRGVDKHNLYLANDLNIIEMIDIVSAVDKDTFKDNPELATQGIEKIQKLAETFKKAGVYIDQNIDYVNEGKKIAEELSKKFFNYGLSLEGRIMEIIGKDESTIPTVLSESEKRELDKWLIGEEIYYNVMSRLGPNPSQEDIDRERGRYFRGYFKALSAKGFKSNDFERSDGLAAKIQGETRNGILRELNKADGVYEAIFRRGEKELMEGMKVPLTSKNIWEKLGNIAKTIFQVDRQKLYDYLEIPRLKEELAEVRSRGNLWEISETEYKIAGKIRREVNRYQYRGDAMKPSKIVKNNYVNCLGSTLLGTSFLDEVGIKYLCVTPPKHSMTFLVTSDRRLYWQDFTPSGDSYNGWKVIEGFFEGNPNILKLAENFSSFDIVYRTTRERYNISSSMDGKISTLLGNLGVILSQKGRDKEAVVMFKKALELNPKESFYYNALGMSLGQTERYREAKEMLDKAIELDPTDYLPYYSLGFIFADLKKYNHAVKALKKGLELDQESSRLSKLLLKQLCNVLERLNKYEESKRDGKGLENKE